MSAPRQASDLVNPLGKDPGSGWRADCGELQKLTCATIKRAVALSHSPRATEIESSRTGRGGPGSSLLSQEERTKRGDGLGDGPALQTLQSLETKPPFQASKSRRDKGSEEIRRPVGDRWLSGFPRVCLRREVPWLSFHPKYRMGFRKTTFWFRSKLVSQSHEADYCRAPA